MNEIKEYQFLLELINVYQKIKQISWTIAQTGKRYPAPELLRNEEIQELTKMYLAMGFDIEDCYKDWLKLYKEYKRINEKKVDV